MDRPVGAICCSLYMTSMKKILTKINQQALVIVLANLAA
jgi:hypothetical protein